MKFDTKTEKLVDAAEGLRIEGEETIVFRVGRRKVEHTYRWMRYLTHNEKEIVPQSV